MSPGHAHIVLFQIIIVIFATLVVHSEETYYRDQHHGDITGCWSRHNIADGLADVSVYCHVDTSNCSPHLLPSNKYQSPSDWINCNTLLSQCSHAIIFILPTCLFMFGEIKFHFLLTFCLYFVNGWPIQVPALSPLELPISYFTVWLLKLPLKICAVLSNWKHKISIMISQ